MVKMGNLPVKLQLGVEYSVERQDDFGPEWKIKLNIIPVVASLQKTPFFKPFGQDGQRIVDGSL
jgi:hypothetical protein